MVCVGCVVHQLDEVDEVPKKKKKDKADKDKTDKDKDKDKATGKKKKASSKSKKGDSANGDGNGEGDGDSDDRNGVEGDEELADAEEKDDGSSPKDTPTAHTNGTAGTTEVSVCVWVGR